MNVIRYGEVLKPLLRELEKVVAEGASLALDETRIPLLWPGLGKTHVGWAHVVCRHETRWNAAPRNAVIFNYRMRRHGHHADAFLGPATLSAMSDGFSEYEELEKRVIVPEKARIELANCSAHSDVALSMPTRFPNQRSPAPSQISTKKLTNLKIR